MMPEVVAILCSDIHLSEKPPVARSEEHDWYGVMEGYLWELNQLSVEHEAPILCGGDVFDRWKASPELINFAINNLPTMYSVAGQHDLPHHLFDDIRRSAFWTLVEMGNVKLLDEEPIEIDDGSWKCRVTGYSWKKNIKPPADKDGSIEVLVTHKYVWNANSGYVNAPQSSFVSSCLSEFSGYDAVLLGDNHTFWEGRFGGTSFFNPGSFMRRRSDQVSHRPVVGLLMDDKTIENHYLDVSNDILITTESVVEKEFDNSHMLEFIEGLKGLGESGLDFTTAIKNFMEKDSTKKGVREIITRAMEG